MSDELKIWRHSLQCHPRMVVKVENKSLPKFCRAAGARELHLLLRRVSAMPLQAPDPEAVETELEAVALADAVDCTTRYGAG